MTEKTKQETRLAGLMARGRIANAYRISGEGSIDFARKMAAALVCTGEEKPCGRCGSCKKAALDIHPDIITVTFPEDKKEILVGQIRDLRTDAYVRPNEGTRKVYIIDPADGMNANAQNAFLKVLEEGPAYAVFLLVCRQPGALLQTVRSRCEEIFLAPGVEKSEGENPRARELAALLLEKQEQKLMEYCVGLEKLGREEMTALLEQTVTALEETLREDVHAAARVLPLIQILKTLQDAARFNVGTGHLAGWLCAAVFQ